MTNDDQVNKLFLKFKGKNVTVDLRDNNQAEGKIIAIDNYLNLAEILLRKYADESPEGRTEMLD